MARNPRLSFPVLFSFENWSQAISSRFPTCSKSLNHETLRKLDIPIFSGLVTTDDSIRRINQIEYQKNKPNHWLWNKRSRRVTKEVFNFKTKELLSIQISLNVVKKNIVQMISILQLYFNFLKRRNCYVMTEAKVIWPIRAIPFESYNWKNWSFKNRLFIL